MRSLSASRSSVVLHYAILVLASAVVLGPLLWALSTSLKGPDEVLAFPPTWIPKRITLQNYVGALESGFRGYFLNSLLVTVGRSRSACS